MLAAAAKSGSNAYRTISVGRRFAPDGNMLPLDLALVRAPGMRHTVLAHRYVVLRAGSVSAIVVRLSRHRARFAVEIVQADRDMVLS